MESRVALYTRVSTIEQVKGVSIETQLNRLRNYAKFKEWTISDEFVDAGWSGKDDNRPSLKRLMTTAHRGYIDVVVVCKIDRLMRNTRLLLQYVDEFKKLGIRFVATDDNIDTGEGKTGQLMLTILAAVAEWERERIGERIAEGKHYRMSQGRWASGRTLYGYRWLPKEQEWVTVEDEAKVVSQIYDLYVNKHLGSMKIPIRLNVEGCRTRTGSAWGFSAINRILTHPAYKGQHPKGLKMPVMIDEVIWDLAQRKRQKARSIRKNAHNWLLQGMCVCGECGHTLSCIQKKPTKPRYYSCRGRAKDSHLDGSLHCQSPRISADWLEWAVWEEVKMMLNDGDVLKQSVRNALSVLEDKRNQLGEQTESLDHQIEIIRGKKERLGLVFADGAIDKETYNRKLQELRKLEVDLSQRRSNLNPEAQAEIAELESHIATVEKILSKHSGRIFITEFGIWGTTDNLKVPLGYNPWLETEGKSTAGKPQEMDTIRIEGTDLTMSGVLPPEGFLLSKNPKETIMKNIRVILQAFDTKVYAFPDRVEIHGMLPTQEIQREPIIRSGIPTAGSTGRVIMAPHSSRCHQMPPQHLSLAP